MTQRQEPMSSVDTAWLHMDRPANLMQVMGVMRFRRRLALPALRRLVAERFLIHERFRSRPVEGARGARWEPVDHFDLRRHVRLRRLPRGGGEPALQQLLGRLAATALPASRPRWEFLLVHEDAGRSALVIRIHHCYADGIALVRVVLGLGDPTAALEGRGAAPLAAPATTRAKPRGAPQVAMSGDGLIAAAPELIGQAWREATQLAAQGLQLARHPGQAAALGMTGIGMAAELAHIAMLPDEPATPLRGRPRGEKAISWAPPSSLAAVRDAAAALGCTINDLLVAAVAGALARWLRQHDRRHSGDLELRAAVPVNLRAPLDEATLGNRFGLVFVELPVGRAVALQRLVLIRQRMQALKRSHQPLMTLGLLAALGWAPQRLQDGAVDLLSRKASLVMSNLPGPREPLWLLGTPAESMMFWVPQSGDVGLGVSVLTYAGKVQFGVMADIAMVPDPARISAAFVAELRALVRLGGKPAPRRRRAPPSRRRA